MSILKTIENGSTNTLDTGWSYSNSETMHAKIMVVDDVPLNVKIVCAHLQTVGYNQFIQVTDSTTAMTHIYQDDPDILLLDIMMPEISGLDILEAVRADPHYAHLPILILTAAADNSEMKKKALELGATDFLPKPIDAEDLIPRVHNALLMKSYQDHLEQKVLLRTEELEKSRAEVLHCLARAGEYRDNETGKHVIRVSKYAGLIAQELGLDYERVSLIKQAAALHDLGKIGIPDAILLKPGKLSESEFNAMKKHCEYGSDICGALKKQEEDFMVSHALTAETILGENVESPVLKLAGLIAATHHEKWDGSGYPRGLKGTDIPLEGRITAIADVFDALSSKRPYKDPFPLEKCLAIMQEGSASHFDPELLELFLNQLDEVVIIRDEYSD